MTLKTMQKNKRMNNKQRVDLVASLEKQLNNTLQRIYDLTVGGRRIDPIHPYVLVRILPKEHRTAGGLYLAETEQNKPVYEGIVIATWRPYDEIREKQYLDEGSGELVHEGQIVIHHECSVKPGDRVCFPHYEGIPLGAYLDDKYYRLVREGTDQNKTPYCSISGIIKYDGDQEVLQEIRRLTAKLSSVTTSGISLSRGDTPPVITTPA
jgi:co-chaperonin GroES (HSP10)